MTFALAPHVTLVDVENGMVLLDENAGRYYQMNGTGVTVLRCLLDGGTPESATALLRDRFPDAPERAEDDVRKLIDSLRTAKLTTS